MLKKLLLAAAILLAAALPSAQAANQFEDNVCENTTTAGTGTVNLEGAATGRYAGARTFAAAGITSGNSVPYSIDTGSGASRKVEIGWGVYTDAATDTLSRDASSTTDDSSAPIDELTLSGTSVVCIGINSLLLEGGSGYGINADLLRSTTPGAGGLAVLDDANAAAIQTTLSLVPGTNVQAFDSDLTTWAGVTPAAGVATFLGTPSSANLKTAVTDETGTGGALVFATDPDISISATTEGNIETAIDTLANLASIQARAVAYADAGADAVWGWDDSANTYENLTAAEVLAVIEATTPLVSTAEGNAAYQPLDADLTSWAGVTRAAGFDTFTATPSSANLDTLVTDDTGSGALMFGTAPDMTVSATTETNFEAALELDSLQGNLGVAHLNSGTSAGASTFWRGDATWSVVKQSFVVAASDETTTITAAADKVTFRMPYAFTVTSVRCSLNVGQTAGSLFTVDINENDTTILSTKVTIDNNETTSTTAVTAPVISDASIADDAEVEIDVDTVGTGSPAGLKCALIGNQT